MSPVPPGDQTGIYYIIVAGLPWQCSWQRLKDFARNQQPDGSWVEVDHAFVYPDSTNGWVRIKGKSDFKKVLAHLNGGELDHRSLIADGRNETETTYLCDLGTTKSSSQRSGNDSIATNHSASSGQQQYAGQGMQTYSPQDTCSEWSSQPQGSYSPVSPIFSTGPYYQPPPSPIYEAAPNSFAVPQHVDYFGPLGPSIQPAIVYAGNMAPTTPVYIPQRQPMYACYPMTFNTGLISPPSTNWEVQQTPPGNTVNGPVVQTEARKVIIKGLPRDTSQGALFTLINDLPAKSSKSSHQNAAIQFIELARHPDGKPKGHAFVVFESHRVAKKVVAAIDGHKFQGKELRATLAKEGVEPTETFHQQGYLSPDSSGLDSESPSMTYVGCDNRQFSSQQPGVPFPAEVSKREYRAAQWVEEDVLKASSKGKEKPRDSKSEDRGRKSRTKSRDSREPIIGTPPVVDGSGRRRH